MISPIAIYLPQFHTIPENDSWWGKGFTEWSNVRSARPLFKGHQQPHVPVELGYYDLSDIEVMRKQASMAFSSGISGFMFYHYWFDGKRLLEKPVDNYLLSDVNFPFMLCWANENWTRRWDGLEAEILMEQTYSQEDDLNHIRFLATKVFADDRYIKVDGKPFLLIYRPHLFPDIRRTLETWRNEALRLGWKALYIGYMQSYAFSEAPAIWGFDCAVDFQPNFSQLPKTMRPSLAAKLRQHLLNQPQVYYQHSLFDYNDYVRLQMGRTDLDKDVYPCVFPMWDNSPRRKKGASIFHNATPDAYRNWLEQAGLKFLRQQPESESFLLINAWNEWGEGCHLEPCQKWGNQYLEATAKAVSVLNTSGLG